MFSDSNDFRNFLANEEFKKQKKTKKNTVKQQVDIFNTRDYQIRDDLDNLNGIKNNSEITTDFGFFKNTYDTARNSGVEFFLAGSNYSEQVNEDKYHQSNIKYLEQYNPELLEDYKMSIKLDNKQREAFDNAAKTGDISGVFDTSDKLKFVANAAFGFKDATEVEKKLSSYKRVYNFMKDNPESKLMTFDDIKKNAIRDVNQIRQTINDKRAQQESLTGEIAGAFTALADPVNFASIFIPVGGAYKAGASVLSTALKTGLKVGLTEGAVEAYSQYNSVYEYRKNYLGDNYTIMDAATNVGIAALGGTVFGSIFSGVGHLITKKQMSNIERLKEDFENYKAKEDMTLEETEGLQAVSEMVDAIQKIKDTNIKGFTEEKVAKINAAAHAEARIQAAKGDNINIDHITNDLSIANFNQKLDNIDNETEFKELLGEELSQFITKHKEEIKTSNVDFTATKKNIDKIFTTEQAVKENFTATEAKIFDKDIEKAIKYKTERKVNRKSENKNSVYKDLEKYIKENNYNLTDFEIRAKASDLINEKVEIKRLSKQDIAPNPTREDATLETKKINNELKKENLIKDKDIVRMKVMDEAISEQVKIDKTGKKMDNVSKEVKELDEMLNTTGIKEEYSKLLEDEKALNDLLSCGI